MATDMVNGNWDPGIKNPKQEMLHEDLKVEWIYKGSAVDEMVLALAIGYLLNLQEVEDTSMEKFDSEVSSENGGSKTDNEVNKFEDTNVCVPSESVHLNTDQTEVAAKMSMMEDDAMMPLVDMAAMMSLVVLVALAYLVDTSELQSVGVDESICTSRGGIYGSTSQLMLGRWSLGVPMVLVCFGVFKCANYWCALWCGHGDDWRYKNPGLVKKIMKDLLDPGEFMRTAESVQLVQVKVAEASLVMEAGEEAYDVSTLEAERSGSPVLVSEPYVQWFIHEVDGQYEVQSLTSKITCSIRVVLKLRR